MPLLSSYMSLLERYYHLETRADEIHRVRCRDNVTVSVKRFLPADGAPRRNLPVVCVPGLGADSFNFDAPGQHGLAPYLSAEGFDVWALDFRGTGGSSFPRGDWPNIRFDDFWRQDLDAAVQHILRRTARDRVLGVGHSMGGLALYAHAGSGSAALYAGLVALCSPVGFTQGWDAAPIFRRIHHLGDHLPGLPMRRLLRALSPLVMRRFDRAARQFAEVDNMDHRYARRLLFHAAQDVPRGVLLQFRDWITHDAFRSADGQVDYRAQMRDVLVPTLVVAAPNDKLARPESVERALDLLPVVEHFRASRENGFSADYGHIDVLFGQRARFEVFPRLKRFLERNDIRADVGVHGASAQVH